MNVACQEIRACGANNVQVARRLREMLDNLHASLPPYRLEMLLAHRDQLDRTIDAVYPLEEDRALARQPDRQGLGASSAGHLRHRAPGVHDRFDRRALRTQPGSSQRRRHRYQRNVTPTIGPLNDRSWIMASSFRS